MRRRPHRGSNTEHEQRADSHEHDLHRAFHLVVEAAPAQMRGLELVLLLKVLDLQFEQTPLLFRDPPLLAQIVVCLGRRRPKRHMQRGRVRGHARFA
jgi:hypothetical protein